MSEFVDKIRYNFKQTALHFLIFLVRLSIGAFVGTTIALTVQSLLGTEILVFMFIVITTIAIILRATWDWGLLPSIILLLVFALIGVLLKLYIHTAAIG
jgi:hypothetical protein